MGGAADGTPARGGERHPGGVLPGQTLALPVSWTVPAGAATGTYTVRIGVFRPGWSGLYDWNDSAATFTVAP